MILITFLLAFVSSQKIENVELINSCKSQINEWEIDYHAHRKAIPQIPIDTLILVAIKTAKLLPSYLNRLNLIQSQCFMAIKYQDTISETNKSTSNMNLELTFLQSLNNGSIINTEIYKYLKNITDSNNNRYLNNLNCFIKIAEFVKIIDALKQLQQGFTSNTNKVTVSALAKIGKKFPVFHYFKRLIENEMKLDYESLYFQDLQKFTNKLVELIRSPKMQGILGKMKASEDEFIYASKLISFVNVLLNYYIPPIVDSNESKLNFSNSIYHNCKLSETKMNDLCNIGIVDDIRETHQLCMWLSKMIKPYFYVLKNSYQGMRKQIYSIYKANHIFS